MILTDNWMSSNGFSDKVKTLGEVMTTKEIEKLYELPVNAVVQDIRLGKIKSGHFRQSGKTWLVTRVEANRVYSNYKRRERKTNQTG